MDHLSILKKKYVICRKVLSVVNIMFSVVNIKNMLSVVK